MSWLSYLALDQQPRVYNRRAEQSQRCEWKNLVVGIVQMLRWRALPAKGTHLFVGGIGDSNSEVEGKAHEDYGNNGFRPYSTKSTTTIHQPLFQHDLSCTLIHTKLIQTHHLQRIMPSTFLFLLTDPSQLVRTND